MARCGNCGSQLQCTCTFVGCIEDSYLAQALILPGTSGNFASTPDSIKTSITGDIDIRVRVALNDWTPGTTQVLVSKFGGGSDRSYQIYISTAGGLAIDVSGNGTSNNLVNGGGSGVSLGFVDGSIHWVRATFVSSTGGWVIYSSNDGITWTTVTSGTGSSGAIFDASSVLWIGANAFGNFLSGTVYYAEVRAGINGDIVAVFDPTRVVRTGPMTPAVLDSPEGEVWTVAGSGWAWLSEDSTAPTCATVTGNGQSWAPINYRPNNIPLPRPYGQLYRANSVQTIAHNTTVAVSFDTEHEYLFAGGMTNLLAFPTRLTAPVDGYYLVHGAVNPDRDVQLFIRRNGDIAQTVAARAYENGVTTGGVLSIVTLVRMLAGDYLELYVFNNNALTNPVDLEVIAVAGHFVSTFCQFWAQWMRDL